MQISEFSVVTPQQSKFIKPVDTANASMISEGDPDLTTYLSELLGRTGLEQLNTSFWILTTKNTGQIEDHIPIQTRILKELRELEENEKLNSKNDRESRMKCLEWFDWTDTLLMEAEKQIVEDIVGEYHDIFARHRLDIEMKAEFEVKLKPNVDKAVYCQNLPMPIHQVKDLIDELALMQK